MHSNFDSPLELKDGVIQACGEMMWAAGENEALVSVTITQKDDRVIGVASSPSGMEAGEDEWMLEVAANAHRKFKKGPAHAVGVISATGDGIDPVVFHWSQDIQLG